TSAALAALTAHYLPVEMRPTCVSWGQWLRNRPLRRKGGIVHAWGDRALRAAALIHRGESVLFTPAQRRLSGPTIRTIERKRARVIVDSRTRMPDLLRQGVAPGEIEVALPRIDAQETSPQHRADATAEQRCLWAPLRADHAHRPELAVWVTSILRVLDKRYRLLLVREGETLGRTDRLARQLDDADLVEWTDNATDAAAQ